MITGQSLQRKQPHAARDQGRADPAPGVDALFQNEPCQNGFEHQASSGSRHSIFLNRRVERTCGPLTLATALPALSTTYGWAQTKSQRQGADHWSQFAVHADPGREITQGFIVERKFIKFLLHG